MYARRLAVLFVAALALGTPARAQEGPSAVEQSLFGGVAFPLQVGEFEAMRLTRWPDPAMGVGITYLIQGVPGEFSVYVYPAGDDLEVEFDKAMEGISVYAEQNREGVSVEVEGSDSVIVAGHVGYLGVTRMSGARGDARSLLYVFEVDGSFLKYRISYAPSLRTMLEDQLQEFLRVTLESISVRPNENARLPEQGVPRVIQGSR